MLLVSLLCITIFPSVSSAEDISASYMYTLSNFTGTIPFSWAKVSIDPERNDAFVTDASDNSVRIFNRSGMEVFAINDDGDLGAVIDTAVDNKGNILLLSYSGKKYLIIVCNYRGEPDSKIELNNIPGEFSEFSPDAMVYRDGHIYLADKGSMKVAVLDEKGALEKSYDIFSILKLEEKKRGSVDIRGFNVDNEGNMLFTIPVLFQAYTLSPDGKYKAFGQRGSAPGKFNITAGIAADDKGNYYVADTLKCAVLIFDKDFRFVTQFGYRGYDPGDFIAPMHLAMHNDRLYVSQSAGRGVSVFGIHYN